MPQVWEKQYYVLGSSIKFHGILTVTFHNNSARHGGGAVHTSLATKVRFHGSTTVNFSNNSANLAGVIFVNFCAIHGLLCDEN